MNSGINKNQSRKNAKKIILLKKKFNLPNKFKTINSINKYNRYSADLKKTRVIKYFPYNNQRKINSINNKNKSTNISRLSNKNSFSTIKINKKFLLLNKNFQNSYQKSIIHSNHPISQKKSEKIYKKIFLKNISDISKNKSSNIINNDKSNTSEIINSNPTTLHKKILSNGFPFNLFKIKNVNKLLLKNTILNTKQLPNFKSCKINSSKNCDASTNTNFQISIKENKPKIQTIQKYRRPLMIDYFESEHKKLYHGFDKLKGKNKYKIPFFIVYKY